MTDQHPPADQPAAAGWYLYGVIGSEELAPIQKGDLAREGIVPVRHGAVCALVSEMSVAEPRQTLRRHADLVQRVFERVTILPARYGVLLPEPDRVVATLLEPYHDRLVEELNRLRGMAQVVVTGVHREQQALERLLRRDRALAARRHEAGSSYDAAIRIGQYVAAELQRMRAEDATTALETLRPHAVDERLAEASHEHMFLRTSFLVRGSGLRAFDDAVGQLRRRLPHAAIRAVGPQPPYAFVKLETEGEPAWA
jgi:Gas vesicle synthesis protein GvpL/GvpF